VRTGRLICMDKYYGIGGRVMIHSLAISDLVGESYITPLKGDFVECMEKAAKLGFDGVEFHMRSPRAYDFHKLVDCAAKNDLKITGIATGMAYYFDGHYMTNPNALARREAANVLIDFLKAAQICGGAAVMFGLMKGPLPKAHLRKQYKDVLFEALAPVVDAAESTGCDFTMEAINRFQSAYLWTTDETLEFVNRFKSERVTIHLDCFHMNIEDDDFSRCIRLCEGKLGYFHFTDNDRWYPGHGHIDFKTIVDALYDIGYMDTGVGAYEYDSYPDDETAALRGLRHIKRFLR
jgi:sugar phosphate isomerase/epimerase